MIDFSVCRKPTNTYCYLQYSSHHPHMGKSGMVSGFFCRARAITQQESREKEE